MSGWIGMTRSGSPCRPCDQTAPGGTAGTVETKDVDFGGSS